MSRLGPDRDANLGPVQRYVLAVFANRGDCTCTDWAAWYPFTESQVRSAIDGLSRRGLVDATGFDGRARKFGLTHAGRQVVYNQNLEAELENVE